MADEITLDAPETRIERFLAAAAGVEGITLDEPETRIEKYLYKIAQDGGSGGGANNIVYVDYTYQETSNAKTWTLTKTAGEILSLMKSGNIVFIQVGTDEYHQLAGVQQLGANSNNFWFPCIDPNPISQSELTYPKVTYKYKYQANGLSEYPTYGEQSGGGND